MFGLPWGDSPQKLIDAFNFKVATFDVCFEEIERGFWIFKRMVKRYYIAKTSKVYEKNKREYLAYCPNRLYTYQFIGLDEGKYETKKNHILEQFFRPDQHHYLSQR